MTLVRLLIIGLFLLSPLASFSQTNGNTTSIIVNDWEHQYEEIASRNLVTEAHWKKTTPATGQVQRGVFQYASTPQGHYYFHTIYFGNPGNDRLLTYNGECLSVSVTSSTFNKVYKAEQIKQMVEYIYKTNAGYAFVPNYIIANPAQGTERIPLQLGDFVSAIKNKTNNTIEVSMRENEYGISVPSSVSFLHIDNQYVPKRFVYNLSNKAGSVSVVFDKYQKFDTFFLPTEYRYVFKTHDMNGRGKNLSSTTTYSINYRQLSASDMRLFGLRPSPKQSVITIDKSGKARTEHPKSTVTKPAILLILLIMAVLAWSCWVRWQRTRKEQA